MSINDCPVKGTALAQRINEAPAWVHADPEVHVADELLEDESAVAFLSERYEVRESCPYVRNTHHAYLTTPDLTPTTQAPHEAPATPEEAR